MIFRKMISLLVLGCAVALISSCSKPKEEAAKTDNPEPDDSVQKFSVVPEVRNGRIFVRWEIPEGLENCEEKVVLYDLSFQFSTGRGLYHDWIGKADQVDVQGVHGFPLYLQIGSDTVGHGDTVP